MKFTYDIHMTKNGFKARSHRRSYWSESSLLNPKKRIMWTRLKLASDIRTINRKYRMEMELSLNFIHPIRWKEADQLIYIDLKRLENKNKNTKNSSINVLHNTNGCLQVYKYLNEYKYQQNYWIVWTSNQKLEPNKWDPTNVTSWTGIYTLHQ